MFRKKQPFTIYIATDHKAKLKVIAAYRRVTMGAIIEEFIEDSWKAHLANRSVGEVWGELTYEDAPSIRDNSEKRE
jgi:hypothetical protein